MAKLKFASYLLASTLIWSSQYSYADVALQGKIVAVEDDGTFWMEVDDDYSVDYKNAVQHVLQDYTRIHYNMLRFHVHGQEIGYSDHDYDNPHIQTQKYAIKQLKEKFTGKPAFIYCIEINNPRLMQSCITDIDNQDVAAYLLEQGYAEQEFTELTPQEYKETLIKAEKKAKDNNLGIWSSMQGLFSKSVK